MFTPGQKVICVRDAWDVFPTGVKPRDAMPKLGCEYIVRSVYEDPLCREAIRLHWIFSPIVCGFEPGWAVFGFDGVRHFEPVTDISVFKEILEKAPIKQKATELVD